MAGRHPRSLLEADKRADPVMEHALANGYLASGETYMIPGFATHEAAAQGRLSVTRAARRRNLSAGCWVTDSDRKQCYKDCKDPNAVHEVHFRIWDKQTARSHIFTETGGDASKLKYNPWTKNKTPRFTDTGEPA